MLRFCVEGVGALSDKLFAGALLALLFDFMQMAWMQLRGSRCAVAAGRATGTFRPLLAVKIGAELGGAALVAFRGAGAAAATLALGGHLVFNLLNSVLVSGEGDVRGFPAPARKPLVVTDALLTAVCAVGALAPATHAATVAGGFVAAFAGIYCFSKFVLGKKI